MLAWIAVPDEPAWRVQQDAFVASVDEGLWVPPGAEMALSWAAEAWMQAGRSELASECSELAERVASRVLK